MNVLVINPGGNSLKAEVVSCEFAEKSASDATRPDVQSVSRLVIATLKYGLLFSEGSGVNCCSVFAGS